MILLVTASMMFTNDANRLVLRPAWGPEVGWWKLVDPDGGSGKGPEVRLAESIEMCCSWKCRYTLCIYNIHMKDEQTVTVVRKELLHDASWKDLMEVILILDPTYQRDIPSGGWVPG